MKEETIVWAKDLNFTPAPDKVPIPDCNVATETICMLVPYQLREPLRAEIAVILKSIKLPKGNIKKEERAALKSLQKTRPGQKTMTRPQQSGTPMIIKRK